MYVVYFYSCKEVILIDFLFEVMGNRKNFIRILNLRGRGMGKFLLYVYGRRWEGSFWRFFSI